MFQYTKSLFASKFDHPAVASMFVVSGAFAIVGAALQFVVIPARGWPNEAVAGFIGIYTVFFGALGVIGYVVLYMMKFLTLARERFEITY